MAITTTPLLGLPYAGADTDETYDVLARLFVKEGQKLTLPEIVDRYTPTSGHLIIYPADWSDESPYRSLQTVQGLVAGTVTLVLPANDATKEAAGAAQLSMSVDATVESGAGSQYIIVVRSTESEAPAETLVFGYITLNTGTDMAPLVAMVGVDAVGSSSAGAESGVDEDQVEEIIRSVVPSWALTATRPVYTKEDVGLTNVANERQYSAAYPPPYPVSSVAGKTGVVKLTASDVGADATGTATTKVSNHNNDSSAHPAIQTLIVALNDKLLALANSDDTTLDQMAEVVAYIKANRDLIAQVTTNKISTSQIVNNYTTDSNDKVLSASVAVQLKALIDAVEGAIPTAISELTEDSSHRTVVLAAKTRIEESDYITLVGEDEAGNQYTYYILGKQ